MDELWKPLPEYETHYLISNLGRLKRIDSGRIRKLSKNADGYNVASVCINNKKKMIRIARKVAEAFIRKPLEGEVVNHIDCDKTNDCVSNLEWTTIAGNSKHARDNGLINYRLGVDSDKAKTYLITDPDGKEFKILCLKVFARENNLCLRNLHYVAAGKHKHHKGYKVRRLDESRIN